MTEHANDNTRPTIGIKGWLRREFPRIHSLARYITQDIPDGLVAAWNGRSLIQEDQMTGALNRTYFTKNLSKALKRIVDGKTSAICLGYLDGANFKGINDKYGHDTGDQLLITWAERMKSNLRHDGRRYPDKLGRMGGDEFALIIESGNEEKVINRTWELLTEWTKENPDPAQVTPFDIGWIKIDKTFFAEKLPNLNWKTVPMQDVARLILELADEKMYLAKSARKSGNLDALAAGSDGEIKSEKTRTRLLETYGRKDGPSQDLAA